MAKKTANERQKAVRKSRYRHLELQALEDRALMAVFTWTGGGGNSNWSNAANWTLSSGSNLGTADIPDAGDSAIFDSLGGSNTVTLDITTSLADLQVASSNTADFTWNASGVNNLTMTNGISVEGSGNVTANFPLKGATATLTKSGTGTLSLHATNTFGGLTTINAGVLEANDPVGDAILNANTVNVNSAGTFRVSVTEALSSVTGSGTVNLNSATLIMIGGSQTVANTITGAGSLTYAPANANTLTLAGDNTFSGGVNGTTNARFTIAHVNALGTGPLTMGNVNALTNASTQPGLGFKFADGSTNTISNNIKFGTQDMTLGIVGASGISNNVTVVLSGVLSGGAVASTYAFDSDEAANHSNTFKLTNTNTFQGKVQLTRGTLEISSNSALGNGNNSFIHKTANATGAGELKFGAAITLPSSRGIVLQGSGTELATFNTNGFDVTIAGAISGSSQFIKKGTGTLTLSGSSSYTGATILNGGVLAIANDANLGAPPSSFTSHHLVLNGNKLLATGNFTLHANRGVGIGNVSGAGSNDIEVPTGLTAAINGTIEDLGTGADSLRKIGDGTLRLGGDNTYTGTTTVSAGELTIGNGGSGGTFGSGNVTVEAGTTLSFNRDATPVTIPNLMTVNGVVTVENGNWNFTGAGITLPVLNISPTAATTATPGWTVTNSFRHGTNQFNPTGATVTFNSSTSTGTAAIAMSTGSLALVPPAAPAAFNSGVNVAVNGDVTLDLSNTTSAILNGITIATGATATVSSTSDMTLGGVVSGTGSFKKSGTNTLTLTSPSTLVGPTLIVDGTVKVGINNALSPDSLITFGSATSNGVLDLNGFNQTLNNAVLATGASAGSQIISNSSNVFDSVLTLNPLVNATFEVTLQDTIGSGSRKVSLVKQGVNALTLPGNYNYSGSTTIAAGSLIPTGVLANSPVSINAGATLSGNGTVSQAVTSTSGTIQPSLSASGILNSGNLSLDSNSNYSFQLQSPFTLAGTDYSRLNVTGSVNLGSANLISQNLSSGTADPAVNSKYVILANDSTDAITGTFKGLAEGDKFTSSQGYRYQISYVGGDGNDVELTYLERVAFANDDTYNTLVEDTPFSVNAALGVLANDGVFPGVEAKLVSDVTHGTLTLNSDGSFTYTPQPDFNGTDSFTYQAKIGSSTSPTNATVNLVIASVNDAPVITSNGGGPTATVVANENSTTVTTVTATDGDVGNTLTYALDSITGEDRALFSINSTTGEIVFKSAPNFEVPSDANLDNKYEIVVRVTDNTTLSDTQAITITVSNVNEPLAITSNGGGATASFSLNENTTLATTVTVADPDTSDIITYSIDPAIGEDRNLFTINPSTGELSFKTPPNFESPADVGSNNTYKVTVIATDAALHTDAQNLTITILNVSEPPIITSNGGGATASISVNENSTAVTTVIATDSDAGSSVSYSIDGTSGADRALFSINSSTGVLTFKSAPNFEAPADANSDNQYEVVVIATDNTSLSKSQAITVVLANVNEPGSISSNGGGSSANISLNENILAVTTVTVADPDVGDTFTFALDSTTGEDRALFSINATTGALSFKSATNFETPSDLNQDNVYKVTVVATDAGGNKSSQALNITITNANDPPVITSDGGGATASVSVLENLVGVTFFSANDPDVGDTVTYSIDSTTGADRALFTISPSGAVKFSASPNFESPADANQDNLYEVVLVATDALGAVAKQTLTVQVTDVNEPVVITSNGGGATASLSLNENVSAVTTVIGIDPDAGDSVTYSFDLFSGEDRSRFNLDANTGVLTFKTAPNFENPQDANFDNVYLVTVVATDSVDNTVSQALTITILNVNEAPIITSNGGGATAGISIPENQVEVTAVQATEQDAGDAVTYSIDTITGDDRGLFTINPSTGALLFKAAPNFESPSDTDTDNTYKLVVAATDNASNRVTQSITVTITNVNEAPSITSNGGTATATTTVNENSVAVTTVTAIDPDAGSTISYSIDPAVGLDRTLFTINSSTGALAFLTAPNFESPTDSNKDNVYQVVVVATDNGGVRGKQTLDVTITNVNDPPTITSNGGGTSAVVSMSENTTLATTVIATNQDGTPVVYSITGGVDAAKFTIDANTGALKFLAAPDFENPGDTDSDNSYEVIVRAADNDLPLGSGADTQTILVNVTNSVVNALTVSINAQGNVEIKDILNNANELRVAKSGTNLMISDLSSDADSAFQIIGTLTGATGHGTKTLRIPFTTIQATLKPLVINTAGGTDHVLLDTAGAGNDIIPSSGMMIDLGSGSGDLIDLDNNTTANTWTISGSQSGSVAIGLFGTVTFAGLEIAQGGSGADNFVITNTSANSITKIDGDTGSLLDTVSVTRDANFVLTDSGITIDTPTIDQTYSFENINRAFLLGGASANTFNLDGWTRRGDNTLANSFGGYARANGGQDVIVKRGDVSNFLLSGTKIETSDGMVMTLAGIASATLEDTGATSSTVFDVSGWVMGANLKAGGNAADTLVFNSGFTNLSLTNSSLKVNARPLINLTGINTANITGSLGEEKGIFTNFNWTGTISFNGGGGSDTVNTTRDANFILTNNEMTAGTFKVALVSVEKLDLKGGAGNNSFDITNWSGTGLIQGLAGIDQLIAVSNTDMTLTPGAIVFGAGTSTRQVTLTGMEDALLTAGAANNTITLNNWAGTTQVNGAGGTDSLVIIGDKNFVFQAGNVQAWGKDNKFSNVENLRVTAGSNVSIMTIQNGYNTGLTSFTLQPQAGPDTLIIQNDGDISAIQNGTNLAVTITPLAGTASTINFSGIDVPEKLTLTGGAGNNTFTLTNYSGVGAIDGVSGLDTVRFTADLNISLATTTTTGTTPVTTHTLSVPSRSFDLKNIESVSLNGGAAANAFAINGWTGDLSLNGAGGNDTMTYSTNLPSITLTDSLLSITGGKNFTLSSIESITLTGTNDSNNKGVNQTFDVTGWTRTGTINAGEGTDTIVMSRDTSMILNNAKLLDSSVAVPIVMWNFSSMERASLTGGASNNVLDATAFSGSVTLNGLDGDDILLGATGNDTLNGGNGNDWIVGAEGNDTILGMDGKDILIGGRGIDTINPTSTANSGKGEDILIGGFTTYDTNRAAIDAILTAWTSANAYLTRLTLINNTGVGTGNSFKLQVKTATSPATVVTTVFDDGAVDTLFGGADSDWFLLQTDGTAIETGSANSDNVFGEVVTDL